MASHPYVDWTMTPEWQERLTADLEKPLEQLLLEVFESQRDEDLFRRIDEAVRRHESDG